MTLDFHSLLATPPMQGGPSAVIAANGMVASEHPLITSAGLRVLAQGGNAFDAAVAAGLVAAVVMPENCGLGGDLFAVVHEPKSSQIKAICGSGASPAGASLEFMRSQAMPGNLMPFRGPHSISVPGMPSGYAALLDLGGSMTFAQVAKPAIDYAEQGHAVGISLSKSLLDWFELLNRWLASADALLPEGRPLTRGERLRQPGLARTLRLLARNGPEDFYQGEVAREIVSSLQEIGGLFTTDDFASHQTRVIEPNWTTYRGYRIATPPPPSAGLILNEMLNIFEASDGQASVPPTFPSRVHLMVESKKRAYADRNAYTRTNPEMIVPIETLLSESWAKQRAESIDFWRATDIVPPGSLEEGDTTYIAVADGQGGMVSLIQSVSAAFGSGVVAGQTGVVMNNRSGRGFSLEDGHPNQYAPGKVTMSTLMSYLVTDMRWRPVVAGGTPGGDGQPQWNAQALAALLDGHGDPQQVIDLPRWTSWPGTDPANLPNPYELRMERSFGDITLAEMEKRGHRVIELDEWTAGGAMQIIVRDPETGYLCGGTDRRAEGSVAGF